MITLRTDYREFDQFSAAARPFACQERFSRRYVDDFQEQGDRSEMSTLRIERLQWRLQLELPCQRGC